MQAKFEEPTFDTIMLETPLFSVETGRQINSDITYLHPKGIIFKNAELYSLFKKFMDESTFGTPPSSLTQYLAVFDDNTKSVKFDTRHGTDNIIGKFFLETNLDWPKAYYEGRNYINPEYKQPVMFMKEAELKKYYGKGVKTIDLPHVGAAVIPEAIIELLNSFDPRDYIKEAAPVIAQAYRTNPEGTFRFFKQDYFLAEVAHQFDPKLSKFEAAAKLNDTINQSQVVYEKMLAERPFSFQMDKISFNRRNGTHVEINASPFFIDWLFQFELGKPVKFANDFVIFKKSENVVSFNKGIGTPGIEITKQGNSCFVCNNQKADLSDKLTTDEQTTERRKQLIATLSHLYSLGYNKAKPLADKAPAPTDASFSEPAPENNEICLIM
ncbi:hypothetical protein BN59_01606 [Legionella massiliensis]|uniref:Uncharacterized protein n=1 Tax=Legionella massiliensis TaxID=1034943 RepID=A0A078KZU4_9GAMM|nr:hypothetical protein [Legionella massiliensis]CDZ77323.1 hypothetical protein BN59_01606 [Legionella massiliensis]CEE13061.1 hypothetical protein BN1094_01606 [Legionella massiliensis]